MSNMSIASLRQYKIGGYAVFDFTATYIAAYLVGLWLNSQYNISILKVLLLAVPFGILVHALFGIKTPLNQQVFAKNAFYVQKGVVIAMVLLSFLV
jgi:hypothetical protein